MILETAGSRAEGNTMQKAEGDCRRPKRPLGDEYDTRWLGSGVEERGECNIFCGGV